MEDNIFYYSSVGKCKLPHECYFTEEQAHNAAVEMLKVEHGYDLYAIYIDDIKIHKIRVNG